jgi:hypothetical protein
MHSVLVKSVEYCCWIIGSADDSNFIVYYSECYFTYWLSVIYIQPNKHYVSEAGNDDNNTEDMPCITWWTATPRTLGLRDGQGDHWE